MAVGMGMSISVQNEGQEQLVPVGARVGIYLAREGDSVEKILTNASFAFERAKRAKQVVAYFDEDLMKETMHAKQIAC